MFSSVLPLLYSLARSWLHSCTWYKSQNISLKVSSASTAYGLTIDALYFHTQSRANNNQKTCICFGWYLLLVYCWVWLFDTSNNTILLPRRFESKQGYRATADVTPLNARLGTTPLYPLVVNCSRSSKRHYSKEYLRELFKSFEVIVEFWLVIWYFQIQVH